MNEKIILEMVKPYLNNSMLSYDDFESIFSMLSKKEQYDVTDILARNNIELVEEYLDSSNSEEDVGDDEFEILYDNDIFTDDFDENDEPPKKEEHEYLKVRKVKTSNNQLIRLIQEGSEQAKQDLCLKNYGLVKEWVAKYARLYGNKLDYEDLEQAGMIGMLRAAEKFDFSMDTQFSTYAVWWIKQAIFRTVMDEGFTIRVPVHKMEQVAKVVRADSKFIYELDYHKRLGLIEKETGLPKKTIEQCLMIRQYFLNSSSLDVPVGEEMDTPLVSLIQDENEIRPEDEATYTHLREQLSEALGTLTEREQRVIKLRFGLDDGRAMTLEEVGREFNVTRERIRQIEAKALRKLRHPSRSRKFRDYMEGIF